ncbi:hypothetical protein PG991_001131 [Apiospora marii]|uniref:Transposase n=1 Tax=Apiospora marii TaxID=335849 RepID=A0ABR1STX8_9PEZI
MEALKSSDCRWTAEEYFTSRYATSSIHPEVNALNRTRSNPPGSSRSYNRVALELSSVVWYNTMSMQAKAKLHLGRNAGMHAALRRGGEMAPEAMQVRAMLRSDYR